MKIVFATNNQNKVREVQNLLPKTIEILSLKDIGCSEDIPETSDTIAGNALQKAEYVYSNYHHVCFADDTGLEVAALNGEPGIFSARYAGLQKNSEDNMQKLLTNLIGKDNRSAQFKTVIAVKGINTEAVLLEGICKGEITTKKKGAEGFGYDPIFKPSGYNETFAQMPLSLKNEIGHRGKAVQLLIAFLENL